MKLNIVDFENFNQVFMAELKTELSKEFNEKKVEQQVNLLSPFVTEFMYEHYTNRADAYEQTNKPTPEYPNCVLMDNLIQKTMQKQDTDLSMLRHYSKVIKDKSFSMYLVKDSENSEYYPALAQHKKDPISGEETTTYLNLYDKYPSLNNSTKSL